MNSASCDIVGKNRSFSIPFLLMITAVIGWMAIAVPGQVLKPSTISGEVISVSSEKIVLSTNAGMMNIILSGETTYKRVDAEKPSLKTATDAALIDIKAGDKLLVTGIIAEDAKTLPARAVYLMSKADIAERNAKEAAEWNTRGVSGKVTAIDAAAGTITVDVRGIASTTKVVVTPKPDAKFLRYAPNSVKFSDAVTGSLGQVQEGDMLRALGDKSQDGTAFAAETILTGAFRTVAGAVKSVDAEKNEVVITDFQTKKDVVVDLNSASMMKRFPEEMAQRLAAAQTAGGTGTAPQRPAGAGGERPQRPEGTGRPDGAGRGMPGGRRAGGIDDMLEQFPSVTAADLKPGEMVAVSSTKTADEGRITAIKFLAGVEPFIRVAQTGGGRRGGRAVDGGFTVPGLDDTDITQ
jgi:hypothetical protein